MRVLGINVKTGSLEPGAPLHEIGLITFDTQTYALSNQMQMFPRVPESACERIDIESLLYSGVTLEEVMNVQRPSLRHCMESLHWYARTFIGDPEHIVYLSHSTAFACRQLISAAKRCELPWELAVPTFAEDSVAELDTGYLDTSRLIGLCDVAVPNRKLTALAAHFKFDEVYTSAYVTSFLQSTVSLAEYFYQDQRWRHRTAILDLLKTCYVYQQISQLTTIPHPGYGKL